MFRPMQLSFGNSAAGQFYKGRSKAHKQLGAFHRPVEKRGQNSGQQLAVDANGTVSHSAVVAFLTGPAQTMLVHEAVQHSLRFGQQLAGNQVTLPCKPRDWAMVKLPPLETITEPKTTIIKASPKQPSVPNQACSTPASSHGVSAVPSINQANMAPSNATPSSDAAAITEVPTLSATEPQGASTSLSTPTPDSTTTPLLIDVTLSPATSTALSTLEEANSSNSCEDSLGHAADEDIEWATSTWTYQDAFEDYETPKTSASILSHSTVISASTTENHSSTESAPVIKTSSNYQGMEDASDNIDVIDVEISLLDNHKATKAQPSLTTSASHQEDFWSGETLHDSLSTQPDTNAHVTPSHLCNKAFSSQPLKTTCMQALNTPCMSNNRLQASAMGSPSGVEPDCEPQSEQQPTGPTPSCSTPSMQVSMAAVATSSGAVKGAQGAVLALRDKLACGAAGLRQSVAEGLRSMYCWRPAAWAW